MTSLTEVTNLTRTNPPDETSVSAAAAVAELDQDSAQRAETAVSAVLAAQSGALRVGVRAVLPLRRRACHPGGILCTRSAGGPDRRAPRVQAPALPLSSTTRPARGSSSRSAGCPSTTSRAPSGRSLPPTLTDRGERASRDDAGRAGQWQRRQDPAIDRGAAPAPGHAALRAGGHLARGAGGECAGSAGGLSPARGRRCGGGVPGGPRYLRDLAVLQAGGDAGTPKAETPKLVLWLGSNVGNFARDAGGGVSAPGAGESWGRATGC